MPDAVTIRPANRDDASALIDYLVVLRAERLPTIFRYDSNPTVEEEIEFLREFEGDDGEFFVAEADGRIVGNVAVKAGAHTQTRHGANLGMSVLASHRNHGVGGRLLDAAIAWCEGLRLRRLELEVLSNNPSAQRFYERKGFVVEGRRVGAVEVDGDFVDAIQMARPIARGGALMRACHVRDGRVLRGAHGGLTRPPLLLRPGPIASCALELRATRAASATPRIV